MPVNVFPLEADPRRGDWCACDWEQQAPGHTRGFYRVLRSEPGEGKDDLSDVKDGLRCPTTGDLPRQCMIFGDVLATTRATTFVDRPPPGRWTYRVALSANAYDSFDEGDVVLVSDGAVVRVP